MRNLRKTTPIIDKLHLHTSSHGPDMPEDTSCRPFHSVAIYCQWAIRTSGSFLASLAEKEHDILLAQMEAERSHVGGTRSYVLPGNACMEAEVVPLHACLRTTSSRCRTSFFQPASPLLGCHSRQYWSPVSSSTCGEGSVGLPAKDTGFAQLLASEAQGASKLSLSCVDLAVGGRNCRERNTTNLTYSIQCAFCAGNKMRRQGARDTRRSGKGR